MTEKEVKELVVDLVMYGDELNPFEFTKEELIEMALGTYEDLLDGRIDPYISDMRQYLHVGLEDEDNDCWRELNIISRLLALKNNIVL